MAFFRKKISAHDLGNVVYSHIRDEVMSHDSPLFHGKLTGDLEEKANDLSPAYILELLIGSLFGALLSIEKKHQYPKAGLIMDGMRDAFLSHAQPIIESIGLTNDQMKSLILQRFQEYYECLNTNTGAGPVWYLGKAYYWNILGRKKEEPKGPMLSGLYMLKFSEFAENILRNYKVL